MLEFCNGWMNIRQNKGGVMIIFHFKITYKKFRKEGKKKDITDIIIISYIACITEESDFSRK